MLISISKHELAGKDEPKNILKRVYLLSKGILHEIARIDYVFDLLVLFLQLFLMIFLHDFIACTSVYCFIESLLIVDTIVTSKI